MLTTFYRFLFSVVAFALISSTSHGQNSNDLASIKVPKDFHVELATPPGLVPYAMFGALDGRGHLFVAQSSGKNIKGAAMAEKPECRILMLEDKDKDGVYEKLKVFADNVGIPMGVLCQEGSVFVASPPDLLRFEDADGDGVAEKRTVLLTGWNVKGTASLHGPFMGPDGWMYLTDGRHGFDIQTKEGSRMSGLAARIWRLRPDGTQLQSFCGGGFDNPVEIVFTSSGEMIGTMTYFTDPKNGQRDALMHWMEGGVYQKWYECVNEFKQTGALMPPMTRFARIAPAGLMQHSGASFGASYMGNLFSAQFNPHRVQRHILLREGATFRTEDEDFLVSSDPDFHPCDVLEDADGSLLVIDTGGWYVDQCPISRVSRPEKTGGIYRVRKRGAPRQSDPFGLDLKLNDIRSAELARLFEDNRLFVRQKATEEAVRRGTEMVHALAAIRRDSKIEEARCAAVWALMRIGSAEAKIEIQAAFQDASKAVRISALHAAGLLKSGADAITATLDDDDPSIRREAATALGRVKKEGNSELLIKASGRLVDRFEEHAFIYSLILLNEPQIVAKGLRSKSPSTRKTSLIALDQMNGSPLRREQIIPLFTDPDPNVIQAALWVVAHHPEWAGDVVKVLEERLSSGVLSKEESAQVRDVMVAMSNNLALQEMIAKLLQKPVDESTALFLMDVIDASSLSQFPASWIAGLREGINSRHEEVQLKVLSIIQSRQLTELDAPLKQLAVSTNANVAARLAAFGAIVGREPRLDDASFGFLLQKLVPTEDASTRLTTARIISKAKLTDEMRLQLLHGPVSKADTLTISLLMDAFRESKSEAVGSGLVMCLSNPSVNIDFLTNARLEQLLKGYPDKIKAAAKRLFERIKHAEAAKLRRIGELEPLLTGGDVGRGRRIFYGSKAACASCHAIGSEGSTLGPDLTSIGLIRSGHDILEAIVFPSASLVPGYEPFMIETSDESYSGLIENQTADVITVRSGADAVVKLPRRTVRAILPSTVSIMPEGLDTSLSSDELRDLLAFLRAQNGDQFLEPTKSSN